ncbi:hypothetical protein [Moorena producens]|nr:hypothetical protein [Moorena producens]
MVVKYSDHELLESIIVKLPTLQAPIDGKIQGRTQTFVGTRSQT